jgi:hypothetical protein
MSRRQLFTGLIVIAAQLIACIVAAPYLVAAVEAVRRATPTPMRVILPSHHHRATITAYPLPLCRPPVVVEGRPVEGHSNEATYLIPSSSVVVVAIEAAPPPATD